MLRQLIKNWLLKRRIVLSRPPGQFSVGEYKLGQMRDRGFDVRLAVDGGAAKGHWAREFRSIFPAAQILCIEPRDDAQPSLRALAVELPGIHIAQTLVGDRDDTVEFHVHDAQSSILKLSDGESFGRKISTPITRLDSLVRKHNLPWPDFIKLDLQGAELQCLDGAPQCLEHAQAVLLEVSFIPFMQGLPLIADIIPYMTKHGFRCYDIPGLWHRPLDGALAQGDILFVREGHALLRDNRWQADGAFG